MYDYIYLITIKYRCNRAEGGALTRPPTPTIYALQYTEFHLSSSFLTSNSTSTNSIKTPTGSYKMT